MSGTSGGVSQGGRMQRGQAVSQMAPCRKRKIRTLLERAKLVYRMWQVLAVWVVVEMMHAGRAPLEPTWAQVETSVIGIDGILHMVSRQKRRRCCQVQTDPARGERLEVGIHGSTSGVRHQEDWPSRFQNSPLAVSGSCPTRSPLQCPVLGI
jgi:hypothetical protein